MSESAQVPLEVPHNQLALNAWLTQRFNEIQDQFFSRIMFGAGSPQGVVKARQGTLFLRTDGGPGSTFYVKEVGSDKNGWTAK